MIEERDIAPEAWFDAPTWGRSGNLDLACQYLASRFPVGFGVMVEVGGLHVPGRVKTNGCSTAAWASHAHAHGREFYSIDRHGPTVQNVVKLGYIDGFRVTPLHGDAEREIRSLVGRMDEGQRIVLLYIDGDNNQGAALAQLQAAEPALADGAVILVDDAEIKGPQVREYLDGLGLARLAGITDYQWGWVWGQHA